MPWDAYPVPRLTRDDVHVLRMSISQGPDTLSHLETTLSEAELARAAAFRFAEDRARHVIARGGLRTVLSRHLETPPGELRFRVNAHGKPLLMGASGTDGIRFNVSHSGEWIVMALVRGRRVGIDVEQIRDDVPHLDLAARFFSTEEYAALLAQPQERRVPFFFATWTRKEAYVKGRGRGLSLPSGDFSVDASNTQTRRVDDRACSSRPGSWRVAAIDVGRGHSAAVAVEGGGWVVRRFDADRILRSTR